MRKRLVLPAIVAVALTLVAAFTIARGEPVTTGDLAITEAWARATPPGTTVGAAYVTIENRGGADDALVAAKSPLAGTIEIHATVTEGAVAGMRRVEKFVVPAGARVAMAPGGAHLMLMRLSAPLREGALLPLTLVFERAGEVTLDVEIAPLGAMSPASGGN